MKVKINGKIFKAHDKEDRQFEIGKGLDMFDLMFFKESVMDTTKKPHEYKIDVPFVSKISYGKFLGCFPTEVGEDYVVFIYDRIQST
jgi:hypothetical protein